MMETAIACDWGETTLAWETQEVLEVQLLILTAQASALEELGQAHGLSMGCMIRQILSERLRQSIS